MTPKPSWPPGWTTVRCTPCRPESTGSTASISTASGGFPSSAYVQQLLGRARVRPGRHHEPTIGRRRRRRRLLGPEPDPQLPGSPDWDLRWVCDLDEERARSASSGRVGGVEVTDGPRATCSTIPTSTRWPSPPRPRPTPRSVLACARGRQARAGREAAGAVAGRGPEARGRGRGARPGADVRPHLLLHAGRAQDPRARARPASSATSSTSTRCGSTSGLVQPDIDVLWDLAPHDLSILDFVLPADAARPAWPRSAPTRSAPASRASAT